jgi:3-deoxy-manno-octulosonate cytidylyltransferase (CMP-KDO synthetase)
VASSVIAAEPAASPLNEARTSHVLAVIPARFAAQRFPGKPLAMLWGKPMLQHVWEHARRVPGIDELVIATDDERIATAAARWGASVEMTSADCTSGTDRVAEVARRRRDSHIILNIQGDEPELDSDAVGRLVAVMRAEPGVTMGTLAHAEPDEAAMSAPDVVKVGVDDDGFAVCFTRRWPVPEPHGTVLRHVGVYAFTCDFLLEFASWPPGRLEQDERLEQLRAVERGVRIRVVTGSRPFAGVDTPEQLEALERRGPRP